jgi:hypothetical protein
MEHVLRGLAREKSKWTDEQRNQQEAAPIKIILRRISRSLGGIIKYLEVARKT